MRPEDQQYRAEPSEKYTVKSPALSDQVAVLEARLTASMKVIGEQQATIVELQCRRPEAQALYIYKDGSTKIARRTAHKGKVLYQHQLSRIPVGFQEQFSEMDHIPVNVVRFYIMGEAGPYLVYAEV